MRKILTTADLPTKVENAPIVGETVIHELDDLKRRRPQEVVFLLAKLVLERYFQHCTPHAPREDSRHAEREEYGKPWLFPDLLAIARRWMAECVVLHDNTFPQLLLLVENAYDAAERIYKGIVAADGGEKRLLPIPKPYDTLGSTRYVDFDTTRDTFKTAADKCHISHVVADTGTWEQKMAQTLEDMAEVFCYVKNQNLGFLIPYTIAGDQHNYMPDFLVRIDDGRGPDDPLNLIVEVTGEKDKEKEAKVSTAKTLWVPAVNNAGAWGRWGFIEIRDPWDAKHEIRSTLRECTEIHEENRMLTRLRIRNFKRLGDVDIELGKSVVFIGPNNSGKTSAIAGTRVVGHRTTAVDCKTRRKSIPRETPGRNDQPPRLDFHPDPGRGLALAKSSCSERAARRGKAQDGKYSHRRRCGRHHQ